LRGPKPPMNDLGAVSFPPDNPPTSDERTWALFAHVLGIICCFLPGLVVWLMKKDQSAFIAAHAKQAMVWQISCFVVSLILGSIGAMLCMPGVLSIPVFIAVIIYAILGAIRA